MQLQPLKVQADIMWAFLDTPNQLSGKYQVDLCNLTQEAVKKLETMGVSVRSKPDQPEKGFFITAKSVNYPIKTEDTSGNAITAKVGNGSKGIALLKPYEYTYQKKKGVGIGINKLIVTDLVVYEGGEQAEEAIDDVL
jgi:hypothetical protein